MEANSVLPPSALHGTPFPLVPEPLLLEDLQDHSWQGESVELPRRVRHQPQKTQVLGPTLNRNALARQRVHVRRACPGGSREVPRPPWSGGTVAKIQIGWGRGYLGRIVCLQRVIPARYLVFSPPAGIAKPQPRTAADNITHARSEAVDGIHSEVNPFVIYKATIIYDLCEIKCIMYRCLGKVNQK